MSTYMQITIPINKIVVSILEGPEHYSDFVSIYTGLPSSISCESELRLTFHCEHKEGIEYVRTYFGMTPEIQIIEEYIPNNEAVISENISEEEN